MLRKFREKLKWLDPFTYVDTFILPRVNPTNNSIIEWVVYVISAFVFAWALYTGIGILLGTSAPIVVVVSPSMEPVYTRGDAIVLRGSHEQTIKAETISLNLPTLQGVPFSKIGTTRFSLVNNRPTATAIEFKNGKTIPITKEGSIVVYFSNWRKQPIIHRVVTKIVVADGVYLLTKGDSVNNTTIDQDCGRILSGIPEKRCISLYPVPVDALDGQAQFKLPFVGCVKLWLLDDLFSLLATRQLPSTFNGVC